MLRTVIFLLECTFSGMFLWLGLYLITRDNPVEGRYFRRWWRRPALAMGLALICGAFYLVGVAVQYITDNQDQMVLWLRLTWWATPLACPTIFWSIFLVTVDERTLPRAHIVARIAAVLLFGYAIGVSGAGIGTNLFFQFDAIRRVPRWQHSILEIPPRYPFYGLFVVLILGTFLVVTLMLFRRYRTAQDAARTQFRWLGAGTAMLVLGAITGFVTLTFPGFKVAPELGDALLTGGLFMMGYGVAHYNALFQQQNITRDFYRSLTAVIVTSSVFVLVFSGMHYITGAALTPISIPLLIWLVILILTLRPWVSERLDQVFLPGTVVVVRRVLQRSRDQLATAENAGQTVRDIEQQMPETIATELLELEFHNLQTAIHRDINSLFYKTNYTGDAGDDYISTSTKLLSLTIVEDTATILMQQDGVLPTVHRQIYQLKALRQTVRTLVQDMNPETSAPGGLSYDVNGDQFKRQKARYIILQKQFIEDIPRQTVQQTIEKDLRIGSGGGYQRLLQAAKQDLAQRLYIEERKTRET